MGVTFLKLLESLISFAKSECAIPLACVMETRLDGTISPPWKITLGKTCRIEERLFRLTNSIPEICRANAVADFERPWSDWILVSACRASEFGGSSRCRASKTRGRYDPENFRALLWVGIAHLNACNGRSRFGSIGVWKVGGYRYDSYFKVISSALLLLLILKMQSTHQHASSTLHQSYCISPILPTYRASSYDMNLL
jgi:hypothetical protein